MYGSGPQSYGLGQCYWCCPPAPTGSSRRSEGFEGTYQLSWILEGSALGRSRWHISVTSHTLSLCSCPLSRGGGHTDAEAEDAASL